ncbi:hypothetical protein BC830DRAFT_1169513 [Chytriomyces sp. MP71]|nr:hypothetical protein BC830DRAFT_1169513 [Chytriomyces sp. MP71]
MSYKKGDIDAHSVLQFSGAAFVHDCYKDIRVKFGDAAGGADHGLFWPDTGKWLAPSKVLDFYELKSGDYLEFKKKHCPLKVRTLDESVKTVLVDESLPISKLVLAVCERLGVQNPDEYSFAFDVPPRNALQSTDSLLLSSQKISSMSLSNLVLNLKGKEKKSAESLDEAKWLNPDLTLREQGVKESEPVLLKKKFFFTDQNVDRNDPVQLNLLFNQVKEMIVSAKYPCTLDEAVQLAAIQAQCQFGNHEPDRHKELHSQLKDFVPFEYRHQRDLIKRINVEHSKLQGMTELNAKFRYVQLSRSLKTYGISFFSVKEKHEKKKKMVEVLLGVTKQSIVRLDASTKDVLKTWPLTHLRRWAAASNSFTLDFGDYESAFYTVQTAEGDQISQLIAGYIDIILKKKKEAEKVLHEEEEVLMTSEEYVKPVKAANAGVILTGHKQAMEVRVGTLMTASTNRTLPKPAMATTMSLETGLNSETIGAHHSLLDTLTTGIAVLINAAKDIEHDIQLPPLTDDPVSREWKQQTIESNVESIASQVSSHLAYCASIINLLKADFEVVDFESVVRSVNILTSNLSQMSNGVKLLSALTNGEDDKLSFKEASRELYDATIKYVESVQSHISRGGSKDPVYGTSRRVATCASDLLALIGKLEVDDDTQSELLDLAKQVAKAIAAIISVARKASETITDAHEQLQVASSAKLVADLANQLVACTTVLAPTIHAQICLDQLQVGANVMQTGTNQVFEACSASPSNSVLESLHESCLRIEDALKKLLDKAKESSLLYQMGPLDAEYDQVMVAVDDISRKCTNSEGIIVLAKKLTVSTTQYINALKREALATDNEDEREHMMVAARTLAELTAKMVSAAKEVALAPGDNENMDIFQEKVGYIAELVTDAGGQQVQKKAMLKLNKAVKDLLASHNLLINAAQAASTSNRDQASQIEFSQQTKQIMHLSASLNMASRFLASDCDDMISQHNLLLEAQKIIPPMSALVQSARSLVPTIGDAASQAHVQALVNQTLTDLHSIEKNVSVAEDLCSGLRLQSALLSMESIKYDLENWTNETTGESPQKTYLISDKMNLTAETAPIKLESCLRDISLSVDTLSEAVSLGDERLIGQCASEAVVALQAINLSTSVLVSTNSDDDFRSSLKLAASGVAGTIAALILAAKTKRDFEGAQDTSGDDISGDLILAAKQAIVKMEMCMPGKRELSQALNSVHHFSNTLLSEQVELSATQSDTYETTQSDFLSSVSLLVAATNTLAIATRSSPMELQAAAMSFTSSFKTFVSTSNSFSHSVVEVSISKQLQVTVSNVCNLTRDFLLSATQCSLDGSNNGFRTDLMIQMRALGASLNAAAQFCTQPAPGHDDCEKAMDILMMALNRMSQSNDDLVAKETYVECSRKATDLSKQMSSKLSSLASFASSGEYQKLPDSIVSVSQTTGQITENCAQAVCLIGLSDTSTIAATPPLLDFPQFLSALKEMKEACIMLVDPKNHQNTVLELAAKVAKQTASLCNLCKAQALPESKLSQSAKHKFSGFARDIAGSTASLVQSIKKLAVYLDEDSRKSVQNSSGSLVEIIERVITFARNDEFSGSAAKLSPQAVLAQKPLIESNKSLINVIQTMIESIKTLCSNPKDSTAASVLLKHTKTAAECNLKLIELMKSSAPGQKECLDTILKVTESIAIIDAAIMDATVNNLEPRMGASKDSLLDTLKGLESLTELMTQSWSTDVAHFRNAVTALPGSFSKCVSQAVVVASNIPETESQIDMLTRVKAVSESIHSLLLNAKKISGTENQTEVINGAEGVRQSLSFLVAYLDGSHDKSGEFAKASGRIHEAMNKLSVAPLTDGDFKTFQELAAEIESLGKRMVEKVGEVLTKVKSAEKFREYAGFLCHDFQALARVVGAAVFEANDSKVKDTLLEQLRQLEGVTTKLVETMKVASTKSAADHVSRSKLGQAGRDVSNCVSMVLVAAKEGTRGILMCEEAVISTTDIMMDLESSLIFAQSGNLDPLDPKDNFSKHKDSLLGAAKALTDSVQTITLTVGTSQNSLISAVTNSIQAMRTLKENVHAGAVSITSGDKHMQLQLLSAAKHVTESLQALIQSSSECISTKITANAREKAEGKAKTTFAAITDLIRLTKVLGDESLRGDRALMVVVSDIDVALQVFYGNTPAQGTAMPDEVMQIAKQLVTTTAALVAAVQQGKQDDIVTKASVVRKEVEDLVRAGRAATERAPEESKGPVVESIKGAVVATKELLESLKADISSSVPSQKTTVQAATRELAQSLNSVISAAQLLVPSGYVDPNDPNVIAERELLSAALAIEAASKKLAALKPQEAARGANADLNFDEQILEAAKAIAVATGALVKSATSAQREIVAAKAKSGRSRKDSSAKAIYFSDGTWSDGLVSAAKQVAQATAELCEAANRAVKEKSEMEIVSVKAKAVATTTAQLIAAAAVNADAMSQSQMRLKAAGKAVTHATDQLVKAAEDAGAFNEADILSGANLKGLSETSAKALEMDAQVSILRMEKELEKARAKLAAVRKGKYDTKRDAK